MSDTSGQVGFRLLKRTYEVSCPPEQRQSLNAAVRLLKAQVKKVHEMDTNAAMDRIAVISALNISHEYLKLSREQPENLLQRIGGLSKQAQRALDRAKEENLL